MKCTNEKMTWNTQDTNLSWYVPKANVDHTISGQGTAISTLDHSATIPRAKGYMLKGFYKGTQATQNINQMKYTNEKMTWNTQNTNLSWYVSKVNVDHTISGNGLLPVPLTSQSTHQGHMTSSMIATSIIMCIITPPLPPKNKNK